MKINVLLKYLLITVSILFSICAKAQTKDAIGLLKEGNKRFCSNQMLHQHQTAETVKELESAQHPFAIVVSCSDSRVSPEIVFDQGLGDIFSIRTAGNVMSDYEEGSIEYAAEHLNTKLVVVMGHQGCGAIKAFLDYAEHKGENKQDNPEETGHIKSIVDKMNSEEEQEEVLYLSNDRYNNAVKANVINGVKQLRKSDPILSHLYNEGKIQIVGAIYNIHDGEVEFLDF